MTEEKPTVTRTELFEMLCADCLAEEPFPREIQVIGRATGWAERIKQKAAERNVTIEIKIEKAEGAESVIVNRRLK